MVLQERDGVGLARFNAGDFRNPAALEDTFQQLIEGLDRRKLVVDLSRVEETMSLGVAVLVAAQGLALIHKTRLAFAAVSPNVAKLVSLCGAEKALSIFETVEAAIEWMRRPPRREAASA